MHRAIIFDATGTLFKVRGTISTNYNKVFNQYGININKDIDNNFLKHFSKLSNEYPSYGHSVEETNDGKYKSLSSNGEKNAFLWWNKLMKNLLQSSSNLSIEKIEQIPLATYLELYNKFGMNGNDGGETKIGQHNFWEIYPEVKPTLTKLKEDGCYLGVISNFDERLSPILKQLDIENFFQNNITTSIDCGYQKPHQKIFQHSFNKLLAIDPSIKKEEVIYVGDNIKKDCIGSNEFGFTPCLINRNHLTNDDLFSHFKENSLLVPQKLIIIKSLFEILSYAKKSN
ncbi:hypothetical protein RB653_000023 [Dictyostelium firmibasis]|uniref:Haloacid dehalogenase-like hydrolase domain-containing protein 3 n=1 Tax=Dictyostelium firmibasis TaxID=79012 RepID=A0AAN7YVL4_9MYCE